MVRRAYLVPTPGIDPDATIGGLTAAHRQALSLHDAGISNVTRVTETAIAPQVPPVEPAIVAVAGAVWHPSTIRRLAQTSVGRDDLIAVGAPGVAAYKCGAARVADTIERLLSGRLPAGAGVLDTRAPEFAVLPRTVADRTRATTLLLRSLDKPADGLVSRHLHRPCSRAVTARLLAWPVTPNMLTLVAAAVGAAGVAVAWRGGYWNVLAGAFLFELQNVLDGCDGELARIKHLRSRVGEWLDQVVDDVLNVALLTAIGAALSRGRADHWAWALTRVALAAQLIHVAGLYAGLILRAGGRGSVARLRWFVGGGTATSRRSRLLGDLTRRDFLSLLYVISAAANAVAVAFVWHALITIGSAIVTTVQWVVWNGPEAQADADGTTDPAGRAAA